MKIWHDESSRVERQAMFLISQLWSKEMGASFKGMLHSILVFKIKKTKNTVRCNRASVSSPDPGWIPISGWGNDRRPPCSPSPLHTQLKDDLQPHRAVPAYPHHGADSGQVGASYSYRVCLASSHSFCLLLCYLWVLRASPNPHHPLLPGAQQVPGAV